MNKSYRIVWNKARNCLMVVAEFASSQGKGKSVGGAVIGAVAAAVMALGAAGDAEATSSSTQVIVSGPGSNLDVLQTDAITVSGATAVWGTGSVGSISVTGTVTGQPAGISIGGTPTNFSFGSNIEIGVMSTGPATTYTGTVSGSQTGISLRTTYLNSGSIINKGLINGTGVVGVLVSVSTIVGSILNQTQAATAGYPAAAGTIRGATGVLITNGSTVSPSPVGSTGISNAGLIQGTSLAGVSIAGSQVNTIINQTGGTISGQWGLKITDGAKIVGNISNAGALLGDVNTGNAALLLNASTITGDVLNSGRVFAQGAVELINTQITGAFTNTGTIDSYGAPVAGDAINLQGSNVLNGFNNTSLIRGAQSGIQIVGSTIAGGFNNTGNIQGNAGAGVAMTNSTLSGGFTSSGTITGLSGVRLVDSTTAGAITNTGVIAATATSGSAISVSGGVKATLANVAGTVIGALNGNMDVSNSGLIALQQASGTNTVTGSHVNATISGNYVQAAAGMLQIGVTGTTGTGTTSGNFSILNVVGSATFAANSKLRVNLNQAGAVFIGQTLSGVVAATSLSTNGFTITDNLAGINFTYATTAGSLSLIATAATVNCGATVSGNNLGTCEVAINNPNLYIDPTGKVGTTSGAINGIGIAVLSGNIAGRIYNRGTIVGSTSAIHFTSGATLTGGLTNAGLINGVSGTAISMAPGVLGGGLTNQRGGTIQGVLDAITLNQTSIAGGLNNSGLISGAFTAINANGATISGGLNNSIGGVISAPVAIQAINSNISGINNSGFIVGAGNTGTAITASGTTVTLNNAQYGQVYGGLQGTLDISNSGVIALQSVSGLSMVAGSHFNGSIAGNFVESGTGALILGVAGTAGSGTTAGNFSVLTVGGTVSLASGSKVKLDLSSTTAITAGETISNLITAAGGLTDNGVQIIGNSAKLDFTAITTTGGLSAAAQLRDANSYANLLSSVTSTVTSYLAFDNPNLSINSATINGVAKGVVVLSAGPANVGRLVNFGVIRANYTGVYLSSGSTVTGGITNTGQIGGTSVAGIAMNAALLQSGINVNAGTIAGGVAGIQVVHSSIAGGVTNSIGATITGGSYGIQLQSSTLVGGIANSGLLRGSSVAGLAIMASTLAGGVTNASNRTITGLTGIGIIAGSTVSGNVANSGLIQGSTLAGSAGIAITGSLLSNNLTNNSGATVTGYSGVWLGANAAINGALNNVGQVVGLGGAALSVSGAVNVAGNVGNSGTLRGQTGINLSAATLTGAITNTGLIQGTGTGLLATGSTLNNTIYNTGSIGGQSGIRLANSTIAGSLSNTGVISGARAAVSLTGGVSIATLNNSGTFVGAAGLQLGNAVVSGSINNTGLMSGGSVGAGVSVAGSTLVANFANSGTLSGQSGMNLANSTISGAFSNTGLISGVGAGLSIAGGLNVAGSFINNGTITGTANAINLANATVVGAITNAGLIYAASNNAITASGGTNSTILNATGGTIVGALNGALNISNSGLVSLTSFGGTVGSHLAASIAGNYLQDGTSTLVLGVNGVSGSGTVSGNYSSLTAGQMILNGSTISVQQNRGNAVYQGQTLANVLVASSGITPNNISIVDDIKSIYYTLSGSGNAYSLVAMAVGSNCTTPLNSAFIGSCQITTTNPNLTVGASGGVYGGQNAGVYVISGAINGRLVNAGTISSNQTGIFFTSGANLQGGVTNTGLIQATLGGYGILMTASGMASLQNQSGTISGVSAGVKLSYSSITGGLTNTGLIGGGIGLLLSNSFISGGLYNAGYMNDVSISGSTAVGLVFNTTSGTVGGYFASNSLISGDVSNSGLITNGILIRQSTISGNFVQNAALGTQTTHARSGLIFDRSNVTGSIINSGTVSTPQGYFGTGIALYGSTVGGSVVNTGQLDAFYGRGISIGGTYIAGGLTNTGSVFSSELTVQISGSTISSGIYNTGHINSGFLIQSASHISNGLVNTGYIGNYGPLTLRNSTINGGVFNALSGTIAGGFRTENASVDSGITNQGYIAGLFVGQLTSYGYSVPGGNLSGGIVNIGTIQSNAQSLQVISANLSGGIVNAGAIVGGSQSGGGTRIYNSTVTGGIQNTGQIYGAVNQYYAPASTIALAITGSTIVGGLNNSVGSIVGGLTGIKLANTDFSGGFTNSGLISGLNGMAIAVSGLPSVLTIANQQAGLIVGEITGNLDVSNSGVLALQTLSGMGGSIVAGSHVSTTITGNYIQSGTGSLRIGATGATAGSYSQMNVSSIASFAPGGQIIVNTNNLNAFNGGDTLSVVSVSGSSSLTVSGLSVIDNTPYISFDWATAGGLLSLVAYSTAACGSVTGNIIASCEVSTVNGGTAASNYTFVNVFSGGTISPNTASSRVYAPAISVISGAAVNGYINNAGLVLSNNTGILFNSGSNLQGGVTNTGLVIGTVAAGFAMTAGILQGGLSNAGGTFSGGQSGFNLVNASIAGGVTNTGLIQGLTNAGVAMYSTLIDSFRNTGGTIVGNNIGMLLSNSTISGGFSNTGLIQGFVAGMLLGAGTNVTLSNLPGGAIVGLAGAGISVAGGASVGAIQNSGYISSIDNAGTIGSGSTSIRLLSNSSIGNVVNTGLIASAGTVAGIKVTNSTMSSLLNNGGSIGGVQLEFYARINNGLVNNGGTIAGALPIELRSSSYLVGGLTNSGFINSSANYAIALGYDSTITGGIYNSGSISSSIGGGIAIDASSLVDLISNTGYISSINNAGRITSSGVAVSLGAGGIIASGLTNSGMISAYTAISLNAATLIGGIANSGTISGDLLGINVGYIGGGSGGASSLSGGINNTGLIASTIVGIGVYNGSTLSEAINNSGTITARTYGVYLTVSTLSGGLTNSGTIISTAYDAIRVVNSDLSGGLTNSGKLEGGRYGLVMSNQGAGNGNITNTGLISGATAAVAVIESTLVSLANEGTLAGGVIVQTSSGTINNSGLITGTSGVAVAVSGTSVTLLNNAAGTVVGAVNGLLDVSNSGLIALQSAYNGTTFAGSPVSSTITGNYVQAASGTLQLGVTSSSAGSGTTSGNYSTLGVGGTASFAANSNINVIMSSTNSVVAGQTLAGVVSATGGLSSAGFSIFDNSTLVDFVWRTTSGALMLVAISPSVTCAATITGAQQGACEVGLGLPNLTVNTLGTISGASQGIKVLSATSTAIMNLGSVIGSVSAIQFLTNGTLTGGITNSGLISGAAGVVLGAGAYAQSITNNAGGSIVGSAGAGISVAGTATVGQVQNSGYISSISVSGSIASGINNQGGTINSVNFVGAHVNGGLTNTGVLGSGNTGLSVSTSVLTGGVVNSGRMAGVIFNGSTLIGDIVNSAGGTISSGAMSLWVNNSSVSGSILNAGRIVTTSYAGLDVSNSTVLGVVNSAGGLISGYEGLLVNNSTINSVISNAGGASIVGSNGVGITVGGTSNVAGISNAGFITSIVNSARIAGAVTAVRVVTGGLVSGGLTNSGSIAGTGVSGLGVLVYGGTIGGISNSGYISNIKLTNSGLITGINNAGGSIGGIIAMSGSISSGVTNSGTVSGYRAISLGANSYLSGGLNNTGRLQGDSAVLMIGATSSVSGGLRNAGQIVGRTGVSLFSSALVGGITNTGSIVGASGTLTGYGVLVSASALDLLTNTGLIQGQQAIVLDSTTVTGVYNTGSILGSTVGLTVSGDSRLGSISNTGYITSINNAGSMGGIVFSNAGITDYIVNTGTVTAAVNQAIAIRGGSSVSSGITNAGILTGDTGAGVLIGQSSVESFTNQISGTVSGLLNGLNLNIGAVLSSNLSNAGLLQGTSVAGLRIEASTILGGINNTGSMIGSGTGTSTGLLIIAGSTVSSGVTNSGLLGGAIGVRVDNSSVSAIQNTGLISGGSGVAITASGAALTLNNAAAGSIVGAVNGTVDVSNSGLIALQSAYNGSTFAGSPVSTTITGNYVQAASGTLQLGVTSSGAGTGTASGNYSTLSLTGSASFAASSAINVVMSSADSVVAGQTLAGVVSAGSLTSNGFSILDNSALIGFRYQTVSGVLNLVAFNTPNCGSVVGTAQVGPCEVGVGIPSMTVTGLGTISGGTQGINVLAANLTGRIINQGTVQGTATAIRFAAGGTLSGGITNSGLIEGLGFAAVVINGASVGGIANNSGTIVAEGRGVNAINGAVIGGGITNTGLIANTSATATGAAAVVIDAATLVGGLLNTGNITSSGSALQLANNAQLQGGLTNTGTLRGGGNAGLYITGGSTLSGLVKNSGYFAGISLKSSGLIANGISNTGVVSLSTAISIANNSTIAGGITNSGTIHGNGNYGISLGRTSALVGGVNNLAGGTISGAMSAISLSRNSVLSAITNSGLISGSNAFGAAIGLSRSTITAGIANTGSIVSAGAYAITLDALSRVNGGVTNSGYISGVRNAGYLGGLSNFTGVITGGINNTGTIERDQLAVFMYHGTLTGGFTNSGVIQATSSFAGMQLYASNLTGDLANIGGTILGGLGGSAALSLISSSLVTGVLSNTGMISGQVGVDLYASQVAGGISNSGSIVGTSGAGVEVGANTTLSGLNNTGYISSVSNAGFIATINNVGGTIADGVTNSGLIYNASGSSITASGSTLTFANIAGGTLAGQFGGDLSISNSGLIALQTMAGGTISAGTSLSASITGNYVQATSGTLQFGVNGVSGTGTIAGNYSTLSVSGSATFAANSKLKVSMSSTTAVQNGQTLAGVLTAGSLTTNGFSITDNSALVDFTYATVGGVLSLIATAPVTVACGTVSSSVQGPCLMAFNAPNVLVTGLGTISGGTTGIRVLSGSIVGGIVNQGSVIGTSYGVAVNQGATTITGSLSNAGLIQGGLAGVYLSNTSISGGLSNASSGTITGITGLSVLAGSLLAGGLTNTGLITGAGSNAYGVNLAGNLAGGLNNAGGTISGALIGINQVGGTLTGGLSNTGVITGITGAGMFLGAANLQGGLSNLGGSITGGNTGVLVSASSIAGAFSNTGFIQGLSLAGLALAAGSTLSGVLNNATSGTITGHNGLRVVSSSLASGLTNAGLISGTVNHGIAISNGSTIAGGLINMANATISGVNSAGLGLWNSQLTGGLSNAGLITSSVYGLNASSSTLQGNLNNIGGSITGGSTGIALSASTITGGISNSGLISGGGNNGAFIYSSLVSANLHNAGGTISGANIGLSLNASSISTGLTNAGLISGTSGQGMMATNASTIMGGLNNAANATISGGSTGLYVSSNTVINGGLTNAGLITGGTYAINAPGLTSIVATGPNSQFVGTVSASSATLSVANGSTLTAGSPMILGSVNVANGAQINLTSSPTATVSGGVAVTNGFTNAGVVNVGQSAATITGNYAQTSLGNLFVPVVGSSGSGTAAGAYGQLHVTGTANFAANTNITVSMNAQNSVLAGGTLAGVVTAGSLISNGFTIVDNSALVNFVWSTVGGTLSLVAVANANVCGATISGAQAGPCQVAYNNPNLTVTSLGSITGAAQGVQVLSGLITGHIANQGLISGNQTGVQFAVGSTLSGGLTNTGVITGSGLAGVVMSGALLQGGLNNLGGSITGGVTGLQMAGSTIAGGISNTGYIQGQSAAGMALVASQIAGNLHNAGGTISGVQNGLSLSGSVITTGLTNAGLITGTGVSSAGIVLANASTITGGLNNVANATISGGATGLQVASSSLPSGLTNAGLIRGTTAFGVSLSNAIIGGSIINNGGTMSGAQNGLAIYNGTTVLGNVSNSGYLQATTYAGLSLGQSYITGSVVNQTGASITGYYGLNANGATVAGGMTNAGLVQGTYSGLSLVNSNIANGVSNLSGGSITGGTLGIYMSSAQLAGGLNNAANATISGGGSGLVIVGNSQFNGGITNAGLITGTGVSSAGIVLANASTITGGLNNVANATISGGATGLNVSSNSVINGGLSNAGLITGGTYAINAPGLTSIVSNGANAQFVGTVSASNAVLNLSTGTLTAANGVVVNSVTVASGALFNLVSNTTSTVSGGITATNGVTNAGIVNVGMANATVTGNYAQTAGGVLRIGALSPASHGSLNVTGLATFAPNASLYIGAITGSSFANGSTLSGIVNAGSLSATTFNVATNSVLLNFTASIVGNSVNVAAATSSSTSIPAAVASQGNTAGAGAAGSLNTVFNSFVAGSASYASMNPAMAAFANMSSNAQISQAVSQSLPVLSSNSPIQTLAVLNAINQSIEARSLKLRGVSSGHEMYGSNTVWMKPFGSWMNQGNMNGAYGFKANAGGLMLGADHQWDDKARVGGAFAWGNSSANSNMGGQNQTSNMYQFVGYGAYAVTPSVNVNLQANGGWNNNTTNRNIGFLGTSAQASYDSAVWHAGVGVDRPTKLSEDTTFIPQARFDYTWIRNQGYSETGAAYGMGLNVGSQTYQTSVLGVDGKVQHKIGDHHMVSTNLGVGYNFSPTQTWVAASYQGASALQFTTTGVNPSAVSGRAGLGYTYKVKEGVDVGVRYDIDVQNQYTNQIATAKARWNF